MPLQYKVNVNCINGERVCDSTGIFALFPVVSVMLVSVRHGKKATSCVSRRVIFLDVALSLHNHFNVSGAGLWLMAVFPHQPSEESHKFL